MGAEKKRPGQDRLAELLAHYERQARWTGALRAHVYRRAAIGTRERALEVGCGGGWLTAELNGKVRGEAVGCDLDAKAVAAAQNAFPQLRFVPCEKAQLPFPDDAFDFVCCHFVLMWAEDPVALAAEMKRVTRPGGVVAALAEPDWGGYLEWPDQGLRDLLCVALAAESAEPLAGRQLPAWFGAAGLKAQVGISAGPWPAAAADLDAAWAHHRLTLAGVVDERKLRVMEKKDRAAWRDGTRLSHLPIAWATAISDK